MHPTREVPPAFIRLIDAANIVCAVLGAHGTISARDDRVQTLIDALYYLDKPLAESAAASHECGSVPDGWKLVPIQPTAEMLDKAMFHTKREADEDDDPKFYRAKGQAAAVYYDMVDVAPIWMQPPKTTGQSNEQNAVGAPYEMTCLYDDRTTVIRGNFPPNPVQQPSLSDAARALVDKLDAIHADPEYQSVWVMSANRGAPYTGPQYTEELNRLKTAISAQRQDSDKDARIAALEAAIRSVNAVATERGDIYGACDQIDNDGHPYQSAWFAELLSNGSVMAKDR